MADSSNITLRLPANGGVDRPITYEELDINFVELATQIDEHNALVLDVDNRLERKLVLDLSKTALDSQLFLEPGVEDVFTINGAKLNVPASTTLYNSPLLEASTRPIVVEGTGQTAGGIRVQIKGYDSDGVQVVGSTDADFNVNGSNRPFVASPPFAPASNSESRVEVVFTETGLAKIAFFTISIQSSGLSTLTFTKLTCKA